MGTYEYVLDNAAMDRKIALITGASSGLGAEFARQLHAKGYSLVLVARREELLRELIRSFDSSSGQKAEFLVADLASHSGIASVVDYISRNKVDLLINNAGFGSFGYFETLSLTRELEMVDLNVKAPLILSHAVIPQMKQRKDGAILNVSSIAAYQPIPYMSTYSATKGFELNYSLALRYELAPYGVRVITLCPGPVATEFGGVARVPGTATGIPRDTAEEVVREGIEALLLNKAAVVPCLRARCLYYAAALLPRTWSTWITGQLLKAPLKATLERSKHG